MTSIYGTSYILRAFTNILWPTKRQVTSINVYLKAMSSLGFDHHQTYTYTGTPSDNKDLSFTNFNEIIIVSMFKKITIN